MATKTRAAVVPFSGLEAFRLRAASMLQDREIHTTSDQRRFFMENVLLGPVYHGSVANSTAMLALNTDTPTGRGCWPMDACYRTDTSSTWLCITNNGEDLADWIEIGGGSGGGMTNPMTTAGDIIVGGVSGAPARLGVGSDGYVLKVVSGAPAWATESVGAARGLFSGLMSASAPTLSGSGYATWINQGSATAADVGNGILISAPSNGGSDSLRSLSKTSPTTPYSIKYLVQIDGKVANSTAFAGWTDGTKYQLVYFNLDGTLGGSRWSSLSSFNSSAGFSGFGTTNYYSPLWFKVTNDGTNILMQVSRTGVYWLDIYSHTIAAGYLANYNKLVIGVNPTSTAIGANFCSIN